MRHPFRNTALTSLFTAFVASSACATIVTLDDFSTTDSINTNNATSVSIINDGTKEVLQGTSSSGDP